VRFIAVSDQKRENARDLADKVGAQVYSSENNEVIEHPDVDAVIVSTSEGEHV